MNSLGMTPLGVTIARKQLEGEDLLEKQQIKKTQQRRLSNIMQEEQEAAAAAAAAATRTTTTTTYSWKTTSKKNKKLADDDDDARTPMMNASWKALVEGVTLYGLCFCPPFWGPYGAWIVANGPGWPEKSNTNFADPSFCKNGLDLQIPLRRIQLEQQRRIGRPGTIDF